MSDVLEKISHLDKNIQYYEKEQVRLETELKNAEKQEQQVLQELEEKNLPQTIDELRSMYTQLKGETEKEVEQIEQELELLKQGKEVVEPIDDIKLPF